MRRLRSLAAPLTLTVARARRGPARWLLPALGIALATAFAGVVVTEGTIAGDQAARAALSEQSPLARAVRVTWQGPLTAAVEREARAVFRDFGLGPPSEVVLLSPVRLDGVVVRPAGIAPLGSWIKTPPPGLCTASSCPMRLAGGATPPNALGAAGVRISIAGRALLRSAAPLGFAPPTDGRGMPVLVTGDVAGLGALAGLSGTYRTHQWVALLPAAGMRSWQLAAFERRLQRAQATLLAQGGDQFAFTAPFTALDGARAQAGAAPKRLLLAGGGALAALALFLVLAIGGLRADLGAEIERLRRAGARAGHIAVLTGAEAGALAGVAVALGAALAVGVSALLATTAGEPIGGVLSNGIVTGAGLAVLLGGWLVATALCAALLTVRGKRIGDLALAIAIAALVLALALGSGADGAVAVGLAPVCCLAAGIVVFRVMSVLLPAAERVTRRGPLALRLSVVTLARSPGAAALAIAFIAVCVGLGGFALSYRATLLRGTADEAANEVPLNAIVSAGANFASPLQLASLPRWQSIADGPAWPVHRTNANYAIGYGTVTVPALGVSAAAIARIHGWRSSDGPAPLAVLARRLVPDGPVRFQAPALPRDPSTLSLAVSAPAVAVGVMADLRLADGSVRQVPMGEAAGRYEVLRARLPALPSGVELEGFELAEPAGLEATNGHQNAENPAPTTQSGGLVQLGPASVATGRGGSTVALTLREWRGVGAASGAHGGPGGRVIVQFDDSGQPGIVRPEQPFDGRAVPVLVDPGTDAAAGRSSRLALTVDGLPIQARVVGVLKRFPTVSADAGGFVVADESSLSAALDAQLPGQGQANELWFSSTSPSRLAGALRAGPLSELTASFRTDIEHRLRDAPVARAVLGTLIGATALAGALAIIGLLVALLGGARDRDAERDLIEQGVGPRALADQLRLRLTLAAAIGVVSGLALALLLTRLAVAAVKAASTLATPQPPLVAIAPAIELVLWGVIALGALSLVAVVVTRTFRWRAIS